MKLPLSLSRPLDAFPNNDAGRRARCKAYANAIRTAFEDVHAPWPLLFVRRDQRHQHEADYHAACVITEVRSRGGFPRFDADHFEEQMDTLEAALESLSPMDSVTKAAMNMVFRAFKMNQALAESDDPTDEDIQMVVETWNVISCAPRRSMMGRPNDGWRDMEMEEMFEDGVSRADIARAVGLTYDGVRSATERLWPPHAMCFPSDELSVSRNFMPPEMPVVA